MLQPIHALPWLNPARPQAASGRSEAPDDPVDRVAPPVLMLPAPSRSNAVHSLLNQQEDLARTAALPALFGTSGLLFADSYGKISHLALQFGNVEFDRPLPEETRRALLGMYATLMKAMAPDSQFTVVCANREGVEAIGELVQQVGIDPARVTVVDARTERGMSIWIRDSMLPVRLPDGTTLLMIQDRTYWPGPEDSRVPALIDEADDRIASQPHPALRIDGGNVLSNQHQIFVGKDSVEHTRARLQELAADPQRFQEIKHFFQAWTGLEVVEGDPAHDYEVGLSDMWRDLPVLVFEKAFQKDVLVLGEDDPNTPIREEQPAFHIDMAVTPIGENKVLVGDPGMAIEVFRGLGSEERARVNAEMAAQAGLDPSHDLIGKLMEVNGTPEAQANYDNVARQLGAAGYEVERIPSMIGLRTTWSLPYLTYNNCMQDVY
ncbi:MAG: hypothetical protein AB1758_21530, partial [Candidatus Eremiobacterota bacterium]